MGTGAPPLGLVPLLGLGTGAGAPGAPLLGLGTEIPEGTDKAPLPPPPQSGSNAIAASAGGLGGLASADEF